MSTKTQRQRLLAALRRRRMTTEQIRRQLHIGMPATRVFELRADGHRIATDMIKVRTPYGDTRVARYHLEKAA